MTVAEPKKPAGMVARALRPVPAHVKPAPHAVATERPALGQYEPEGQTVATDAVPQKWPIGHVPAADMPATGQYWPLVVAHAVCAVAAPPAAKNPIEAAAHAPALR